MGDQADDTTPPRRRRDSDEQSWSRYEKLVLSKLDDLSDDTATIRAEVGRLTGRVHALETRRAETVGGDQVRREIWKWVLGVLATLVAAAALYLAGKAAG